VTGVSQPAGYSGTPLPRKLGIGVGSRVLLDGAPVAWPKRAAKLRTDLDENVVREYGLANGRVDVKVCAVDATWSGLKFVTRLADR
jgi:hypothetical protein